MRKWMQRSFRNRVFVTVSAATLIPILLCNVLLLWMVVTWSREHQRIQGQQQLDECYASMSGRCHQMEEIANRMCSSTAIRSALRKNSDESSVVFQLLFRETESIRPYCSVDICLADGSRGYTTQKNMAQERYSTDWGILRAAAAAEGVAYSSGTEHYVMQSARAVRTYDGKILGFIVFNFSEENLEDVLQGCLGTSSDFYLFNPQGRLIFGSNSMTAEKFGREMRSRVLSNARLRLEADNENRFYFRIGEKTQCILMLSQPRFFTTGVLATFNTISFLLGAVCLLVSLLYALLLSHYLTDPVNRLSEAMGKAEKGDLSVQLDLERQDEVGHLGDAFNRMIQEYKEFLQTSVHHQKELDEIKVRMMQAQLNPHFLYNTLDSMKWLGVTNHVPQIAEISTDLAALLRASISSAEFITVEQELELIERYLEIQYIRFADKFTCEVDVEERFQHCMLPKLALQPLVENAIIHGVADMEEGYIKITARAQENTLILSVTDNGCGIPSEILYRLNHPENTYPEKHLGLYNVSRIIGLHYGEAFGLKAVSVPGEGSTVELHIPMIQSSAKAEETGE